MSSEKDRSSLTINGEPYELESGKSLCKHGSIVLKWPQLSELSREVT